MNISNTDYRKLILATYWKRYVITIAITLILSYVIYSHFAASASDEANITTILIFLVLFSVYLFFSVRRSTGRAYKSNQRLHEPISWDISGHMATISGKSFSSSLDLNKCHRIIELKEWFLLYENNTIFHFISKKGLTLNEIDELRQIFGNLSGVPNISLHKD